MLKKVFRQGLVCNLVLFPKCMDRLLCSSFGEKIAVCRRVEHSPWTVGLENLFANEEKLRLNLVSYLVVLPLVVWVLFLLERKLSWFVLPALEWVVCGAWKARAFPGQRPKRLVWLKTSSHLCKRSALTIEASNYRITRNS